MDCIHKDYDKQGHYTLQAMADAECAECEGIALSSESKCKLKELSQVHPGT